jgi:hypothetical protein
MPDLSPTPDARIRVMQIIAGALIAGVVVFGVIVVFGFGALNQPPAEGVIRYMALGFIALELVPFALVPTFVTGDSVTRAQQGNRLLEGEGLPYGLYQTRMIIRFALLEGAAFFNLVAVIIEHHWWNLAAAGALAFAMLLMFPTRTRVEQWIETQRMQSDINS